MGFLKHFRSRSRLKARSPQELGPYPKPRGPDRISALPEIVLRNIFSLVCPHVGDETYQSCESSLVGEGCMLCGLRDLSHCAQVSRAWYSVAQDRLYRSIRIDAVHYCPLEEEFSDQRKKKRVDPAQIPTIRLQLLQRTVWDNSSLATRVLFLKLPYMTRETCKADLARIVSVLPNLRYVDLPDGFYSADPSSQILRDELQASCLDIRKMTYNTGSEYAFEALAHGQWRTLETLELNRMDLDYTVLRFVLGSLPVLHELKLCDLPRLDDSIFQSTPNLPMFPPLQRLQLQDAPGITSDGLVNYLSHPASREVLHFLSLSRTGITIPSLHTVLWSASHLIHLSITESITRSFPLDPIPPLMSLPLKTLHYEITSENSPHSHPADSYYAYLASSLHANALPSLQKLYVRDAAFPETLLVSQTGSNFAGPHSRPASSSSTPKQLPQSLQYPKRNAANVFNRTLEIYTKGPDELEWMFAPLAPERPSFSPSSASLSPHQRHLSSQGFTLAPPILPFAPHHASHQRHQSFGHERGQPSVVSIQGRPVSAHNATRGLGPNWGGEARKSVMISNGYGGFLPVSGDDMVRGSDSVLQHGWGLGLVDGPLPPAGLAGIPIDGPSRPGSSYGAQGGGGGRTGGGLKVTRPGSAGSWKRGHGGKGSRSSRADLWR